MAFSKIVLTFINFGSGDPTGETCGFQINGIPKNETAVAVRTTSGQWEVAGVNSTDALNYKDAWTIDYAGTSYTVSRTANQITITANYDGAVFSDFSNNHGRISAVITNVPFTPPFDLTTATLSPAASNQCTNVLATLSREGGTPPFTWVTPNAGLVGLAGTLPRVGGAVSVTIVDSLGANDVLGVNTPLPLNNTAIDNIVIEGDPSGLHGSVTIYMEALLAGMTVVYEYSLDNTLWQSSNIFGSVLPGLYTLYVRDQYGCTISEDFEVTLETIRPPVYRIIPKSNSFGWYEEQAPIMDCINPYNGTNAMPNNYKPMRFYNPRYLQPWCSIDNPPTQFRSNYDTLTAELFKVGDSVSALPLKSYLIEQKSNNIGKRQIMDARIYDKGSGQTGVYWITGNIYDTDGTTVISTYVLNGQLPEWAKVGQKFTITGSLTDGIYEIKQVIFDSLLLVNAAIIDRVWSDPVDPTFVKVDASYNKLNYETYEFYSEFGDLPEGCYEIRLKMTDSLLEYPDSIWKTYPFKVTINGSPDHVYLESSDHIDDGIDYSTGIIHKQRFQGLFYEEEFPSTYETSRDSRKSLNKLDGRVQKMFYLLADDVPYWVYEKLALFISKNLIRVNNLEVQFEEGFEVERNRTYSRVNLTAEAFVSGYEQYITNAYDNL